MTVSESSPTVADGTVFVGSDDNSLYALDAATGEQVWTFETGNRVRSSPTVAGGTVLVGSDDNSLYALDAATGEPRWAVETDGPVTSSPVVDEGTLYIGRQSGVEAVAVPAGGTSEGSRTRLGTLNHPSDWRYAGQELDSPNREGTPDNDTGGGGPGDNTGGGSPNDDTGGGGTDGSQEESVGDDGLGPGLGVETALAALGGLLLERRHADRGDQDEG